MKYLALLLLAGCSNIEPYVGPPGPPEMNGVERMWPDINGKLRRETVLGITNKNTGPLDGILDCEPGGARHHHFSGRHGMGSRMTVQVPPRSTMFVLLDRDDHVCALLPVE